MKYKDLLNELESYRGHAWNKIPITDITKDQLEFIIRCRNSQRKVVYTDMVKLWNRVDGWSEMSLTRLKEWCLIIKNNNWKIPK